jgi:hypothetical protein
LSRKESADWSLLSKLSRLKSYIQEQIEFTRKRLCTNNSRSSFT